MARMIAWSIQMTIRAKSLIPRQHVVEQIEDDVGSERAGSCLKPLHFLPKDEPQLVQRHWPTCRHHPTALWLMISFITEQVVKCLEWGQLSGERRLDAYHLDIIWMEEGYGVEDGSGIITWLKGVFHPVARLQDKRKLRNHAGFGKAKANERRVCIAKEHNQLPHDY